MKVHRLVALTFIPITDTNKNQINHIDGNKVFNLPFSTLNAMLNNRIKNKTNLRYV